MFANNGRVDGARIHVKFFTEDVAKTLSVEESAGADDLIGGLVDIPIGHGLPEIADQPGVGQRAWNGKTRLDG